MVKIVAKAHGIGRLTQYLTFFLARDRFTYTRLLGRLAKTGESLSLARFLNASLRLRKT